MLKDYQMSTFPYAGTILIR